MDTQSATSASLIARLGGAADPAAWDQFVRRYGPQLLGWCRRWGLQPADAEDICQDVLLRVAKQMEAFKYDASRSFRGWLKTVARRAWADWSERGKRPGRGSGDTGTWEVLSSVEAQDDLVARVEAEFDRELLDLATAQVRLRVEPATWQAFQLTAIDGLSAAEAAERTGLKLATVFVAKSRVLKMLAEAVAALEANA